VIQCVFDHDQFLFCDRVHAVFLWNLLAQQTVEVFVAAVLPAATLTNRNMEAEDV
jgi:hypothetical protein